MSAQPEQVPEQEVKPTASGDAKKRRRTLVIAVGAAVLAVCICVGLCLIVYVGDRESPVRVMLDLRAVSAVADQFMTALEQKDAEAAYALLSTRVQQQTTPSEYQEMLDNVDFYALIEGYESLSVTEGGDFGVLWDVASDDPQMPQGTVANLSAVMHYEGGFEGTLVATFEREGGKWRVYHFNIYAPPDKINSP